MTHCPSKNLTLSLELDLTAGRIGRHKDNNSVHFQPYAISRFKKRRKPSHDYYSKNYLDRDSGYSAPSTSYKAPSSSYEAPSYDPPSYKPSYDAPSYTGPSSYEAPSYSAPEDSYHG